VCKAHVAVAAEVLEQLDLAESSLGENLLAEDIGDLLDGDTLVGLVVHGGADEEGSRCQHGGVGLAQSARPVSAQRRETHQTIP
jgi:hypothetical protein